MNQNQALVVRAKGLRQMLDRSKDQIAMALPRHITPERMIRVALTAARKDSKIMECDLTSIVGAVVEASQLGLEPDGVLGYAYLVPFGTTCTLIPGYKGLISLAKRAGEVANVWSMPVFKDDPFEYQEGLHRDLRHKPNLDTKNREDARNLTYVYAVISFKDRRDPDFEVMTVGQVQSIRAKAKSQKGPWSTDFVEMARKTVIKRLLKRHDLSPELARAQALDDAVFRGEPVNLSEHVVARVVNPEPVPVSKLDALLDTLTAGPEAEKQKVPEPEPEPPAVPDPSDVEPPADGKTPWDDWGPKDQDEAPPPDQEAPQADRRKRKTCKQIIREQIHRLGSVAAVRVRNAILEGHGLTAGPADPEEMDLEVLRHMTRALEREPVVDPGAGADDPPAASEDGEAPQ